MAAARWYSLTAPISKIRTRAGTGQLREAPHPLIIGATGGSGTRVITRIAQHAGVFMGANLNHALDSADTAPAVQKWIPRFLHDAMGRSAAEREQMRAEFESALARHRRRIPHPCAPWGFKNPRGILLLAFYNEMFPRMKFIHLVRDGRDMAFSSNQKQVERYAEMVIEQRLHAAPLPVRSIAMWSKVNLEARRFGEDKMKGRYLCIRFEDLCARPRENVTAIFDFLETPGAKLEEAIREVAPPKSIGRWREQNPALLPDILREGREALAVFDYS
jgi:hypothetical protein